MCSRTTAVEKIEHCHLSQWLICNLNPSTGRSTELVVKKSIEAAMIGAAMRGTVRLNDEARGRLPDIYADICGRHLSFDCRHWTDTAARGGKVYLSREFYGTARGRPSLTTFLKDSSRFLFVAFELAVIDPTGHRERRLFCIPGPWLQYQFERSTGVKICDLAEAWLSFGKNQSLLYDLDMWKLIEIADEYHGGVIR